MALTKSQKVFKRAIMLRKKTGMSLKAAFKAAKKGGAEGEMPGGVADALKAAAEMPKMPSAPSGPGGSEGKGLEEASEEVKKEGGRRRGTKRGKGKGKGGRSTRRHY